MPSTALEVSIFSLRASASLTTATGAPLVRAVFADTELREYGGEMVLPDIETTMILWPGYGPQLADPAEDAAARAEFERLARERIAREGVFRLTRHDGVFVARV